MKIPFNWGTGIALTYTTFALATSAFVAFAMERRVDLVSADYYAQSLQVDRRMEAERNAGALGAALSIEQLEARTVRLIVPEQAARGAAGRIHLYRASSARDDRQFELSLDAAGRQDVSVQDLAAGQWLLQVEWSAMGRPYYVERRIILR